MNIVWNLLIYVLFGPHLITLFNWPSMPIFIVPRAFPGITLLCKGIPCLVTTSDVKFLIFFRVDLVTAWLRYLNNQNVIWMAWHWPKLQKCFKRLLGQRILKHMLQKLKVHVHMMVNEFSDCFHTSRLEEKNCNLSQVNRNEWNALFNAWRESENQARKVALDTPREQWKMKSKGWKMCRHRKWNECMGNDLKDKRSRRIDEESKKGEGEMIWKTRIREKRARERD